MLTRRLKWRRKSAPRMGCSTSARMNTQRKVRRNRDQGRGDGSGGPGGHRPPQFFRLGGHRGAQSILSTSSESVSSYSIVTWC